MTLAPQQPIPDATGMDMCDPITAAMMDDFACKPVSELDQELFAMLDNDSLFADISLPDIKGDQPFIRASDDGGSSSFTDIPMVAFDQLHPDKSVCGDAAAPAQGSTPASPSSSDTSYKPAASDSGSDFVESSKALSPPASKAPKVDPRIGRRKAEVDLQTIPDINERRKQRRLAKNRATAATSRARKRALMATLQQQVDQLTRENNGLKGKLAACCCARDGGAPLTRGTAACTRL